MELDEMQKARKEFLAKVNERPRILTGAEVQACLEGAGVLWLYRNGGKPHPEYPHAILHSGKHSDGFVNAGEALKANDGFRKSVAMSLLHLLPPERDEVFTHVVGADTSSTALAGDIAELSGAKHIRMVKGEKEQIWHPENEDLGRHHLILHVEELITTKASAEEVRKGIRQRWTMMPIYFARCLLTMIDRSDPANRAEKVEDSKIIHLLRLDIRNFDADCPYCKAGSEAIKPKEGGNWEADGTNVQHSMLNIWASWSVD